MDTAVFEKPTWAIVELMGRQVIAGQISEVAIAGAAMLRVDVPAIYEDGQPVLAAYTKFYGATALYGITPTDEASARHAIERLRTRPISVYQVPFQTSPQLRMSEATADDESPF